MKKTTLLILAASLFLSGCNLLEQKNVAVASEKIVHPSKIQHLVAKNYEFEMKIVDPRDSKIVKVVNPLDYADKTTFEADMAEFAKQLGKQIDQPMIPVKMGNNGELIPGKNRVILDEKALVDSIVNYSVFDKELVLPIRETAPNVTKDTVIGLDEVVLGSFTTRFDPSVKGRVFNIDKSANTINQIVLGPGDRFYFNSIVGNASKANGYQLATVIVNGEFVPGYGGGVCQTSSTLYNAVTRAGLEILELHHHSKSVGYVPQGKDATVAYGYKDFKFSNNRSYPIKIKTVVNGTSGLIEVKITSAKQYVSN